MSEAPQTPEQVEQAMERLRADYEGVRGAVASVIVGHAGVVHDLITAVFCAGHVLLEGVPGIGKTLMVRTLAQALDLRFARIQFTPDLMPADISGTTVVVETDQGDGHARRREFVFQPGPIFAQIVLADEVNRATPKTQSALLEAMQERSVTVGGVTRRLQEPFFVLATQNPLEQEGTYPLPEAQLDRFLFKLLVGTSSRAELAEILRRTTAGPGAEVRPVLDGPALLAHQALIRRVPIADHVQDYAVRLVLGTHPRGTPGGGVYSTPTVNSYVRVGASPRAAQSLVLGAKCRAILDGRAAVSLDDLRAVALPALRHRLILTFEAEAEGVTPDSIVENLVATLPASADA